MRRIPAVLTAAALLPPLAACGGNEEGGAADRVTDVVRQAIEDARERRNESTGGQQAQGVLRELQADCYAGAWSAFVADRGGAGRG